MIIEKVKEMESCYIINDCMAVPKNSENSDYKKIQKWITEGGIVEQEDLLAKAKSLKISKIKYERDQRNIEPITNQQAFILDEDGVKTSEQSYFLFYTNRHLTNPTSDPSAIISRVLDLGAMPYFTRDAENNKITVELTSDLVKSLHQAIAQRNDDNYKLSNEIEIAINNATTIEEVEAISWTQNP